jgi:hypothetical protein
MNERVASCPTMTRRGFERLTNDGVVSIGAPFAACGGGRMRL